MEGYPMFDLKNISFIEQVKSGTSGYLEVVQITFDTSIFSYQEWLDLYWPQIDSNNDGVQFFDRGPFYRTALFIIMECKKS